MKRFFLHLLYIGALIFIGCGGQKEFDAILIATGEKIKVYADFDDGTYEKVDSTYVPVVLCKGCEKWEFSEHYQPSLVNKSDTLISQGYQEVFAWAKIVY